MQGMSGNHEGHDVRESSGPKNEEPPTFDFGAEERRTPHNLRPSISGPKDLRNTHFRSSAQQNDLKIGWKTSEEGATSLKMGHFLRRWGEVLDIPAPKNEEPPNLDPRSRKNEETPTSHLLGRKNEKSPHPLLLSIPPTKPRCVFLSDDLHVVRGRKLVLGERYVRSVFKMLFFVFAA